MFNEPTFRARHFCKSPPKPHPTSRTASASLVTASMRSRVVLVVRFSNLFHEATSGALRSRNRQAHVRCFHLLELGVVEVIEHTAAPPIEFVDVWVIL